MGFSYVGIGRIFGVTHGAISMAVMGVTWKHIFDKTSKT